MMLIERDGRFFVQGSMTMPQASALVPLGEAHSFMADWTVDLSEVGQVDSSSLAVVLAWLRKARQAGHTLSIVNPPPAFLSLSALYGIDELLAGFMEIPSDKANDAGK